MTDNKDKLLISFKLEFVQNQGEPDEMTFNLTDALKDISERLIYLEKCMSRV